MLFKLGKTSFSFLLHVTFPLVSFSSFLLHLGDACELQSMSCLLDAIYSVIKYRF